MEVCPDTKGLQLLAAGYDQGFVTCNGFQFALARPSAHRGRDRGAVWALIRRPEGSPVSEDSILCESPDLETPFSCFQHDRLGCRPFGGSTDYKVNGKGKTSTSPDILLHSGKYLMSEPSNINSSIENQSPVVAESYQDQSEGSIKKESALATIAFMLVVCSLAAYAGLQLSGHLMKINLTIAIIAIVPG